LDEPMTGLDYREQRTLVTLLENLHRAGTTILVISHAPWFVVGHAERAIMMSGGRAVFDGPIEDLLARGELLREACFALPEATELGLRLAVAARSPEDLVERLEQGPPREDPR
ncbi:MAG: ABC transporter ATP-binding protein, partial [Deltaproteobacteria bacterium]